MLSQFFYDYNNMFILKNRINTMRILYTIGHNIKNIVTSLLMWFNDIKKLDYTDIVKNFVVALLGFFVVYLTININTIKEPIIYGICGVVSMFVIIMFLKDSKKKEQEMAMAMRIAIRNEKNEIKRKKDEAYDKTSEIEDKARELTSGLISSLNGDISTVEMLHNSDVYDGGVHCRYYDESFPSTREGVFFDALKYQKMPTSVIPLVNYMEKKDYWFTDVETLKKIDMSYAMNIKNYKTHHIAFKFMKKKNGRPLGILTCSWNKGVGELVPNKGTIEDKMRITAAKLEAILDITDDE